MSISAGTITKISAMTVDEIGRVVGAASYGAAPITSIESSDGSISVNLTTNVSAGEASCDLMIPPQPFRILRCGISDVNFVNGVATVYPLVNPDVFLQAVVLVSIESAAGIGDSLSLDRFMKGTHVLSPDTTLATIQVFASDYVGPAKVHYTVMSAW